MYVQKTDFHGDANIGLYGMTTDKYAVFAQNAKFDKEVLNVPIAHTTIGRTNFAGMFLVGNSNGLLVSSIIQEEELKNLKEQMKKIAPEVTVEAVDVKDNVLGNLIVCNDNVAIVSKALKSVFDKIGQVLKVPVIQGEIMGIDLVGSFCVATNKGFLLTINAEEPEYEFFKKNLKVNGDIGSVNFGGIFVKSGIIANSNGFLVGSMSTGPEIGRIDESLGFV